MTVRLARDMGMPIIAEYSRRFGVYDNLMPALSMALGAGETTLLRMVTAYSVVANGGKQVKPSFIDRVQDRYGRTIWRHDERECSNCAAREWSGQPEPDLIDNRLQVIDPMSAFQMTSIMEGVVQSGTAQRLKVLKRPIAGKTGTTNDYKDAWFVGFTPDLAVGVYIGYDQPVSMGHGETGGSLAAPVVRDFLREALKDVPPVPFRAPSGIKLVRVNHKSGLPSGAGDRSAIVEAFKPGQEPAGSVEVMEGGEMAEDGSMPPPPDGYAPPPPPGYGPPAAPPPPAPPPFGRGPAPGNDRALTSGTGGLY
jgi:penicillin-binding protein 1A